MDNKSIDDRLREFENQYNNNWQSLIFRLRRHMDIWAMKSIKPYWGQMKLSYWPVIFNISVEGSTAAEISRKSMVVKQNMSRTIKELEEKGMIISKTNKKDKRSECLELTPEGKQFILESDIQLSKVMVDYIKLVGKEDLEIAVRVLNKLIIYHENLNEFDENALGD